MAEKLMLSGSSWQGSDSGKVTSTTEGELAMAMKCVDEELGLQNEGVRDRFVKAHKKIF